MPALTAEQLPEAAEQLTALTEWVTEGMAAMSKSIDGLFTVFQEWKSALIDANYREHIDGHLTYKIGDGARFGHLRNR